MNKAFNFEGFSPFLEKQKSHFQKMAISTAPIVISGETGTGKDFLAVWLHKQSSFPGPFISVNVSSIPQTLFETELFGYASGAFTDAGQGRIGKIALAHEGTLLLDGLEGLDFSVQAKLLRVLQEGSYYPVGSNDLKFVSCRFMALSQKKLSVLLDSGILREDLYYRLNVLPVHLLPLRERPDDISFFVEQFCLANDVEKQTILRMQSEYLGYSWPGNVRELLNTLEYGAPVPIQSKQDLSRKTLREALMLFKKGYIRDILRECNGNQTKAAYVLGIERTYLARLIKEFSIRL